MLRRDLLLSGLAAPLAVAAPGALANMSEFFVPAEEHPHEATFMQWPVSRVVYPDRAFLDWIQDTITEIANAISDFEPVILLAAQEHHANIRRRVAGNVTLWDIPTEDLWCRDSGPIVAIDGRGNRVVQHIRFNGWGQKQVHDHDGLIAERVADRLGIPLLPTSLQGEAGGVEQDGHGLLMAHESSWVIDNRNPGMSRSEIEAELLRVYGAERMIWSDGVWGEDITDYHIDSLARFTGPGRVLINLPDDPDLSDPFHVAARDTHDTLKAAGLEIEVIPEPVLRRFDSEEFVASYVNYYVCNGGVVMPQFGDADTDTAARDAVQRHYPDREIVMLNADALGEVGGGIHCATQQLPAA